MAQTDEQDSASRITIWPICIALFGVPAIAAAWQDDFVLAGSIATIGIGAWMGFRVGALRVLATFGFAYVALHFAPQWSPRFESLFQDWTGYSGLTNRVTTFAGVAFVVGCGFAIAASILSRTLLKDGSSSGAGNRWAGFLIGAAEGAISVLLFLGGLQLVEPMLEKPAVNVVGTETSAVETDGSVSIFSLVDSVSNSIFAINQQVKNSHVEPVLQKYNPYRYFPKLNRLTEIRKTVQLVNQPREIEGLLNSSSFQELQNDPEVAAAVEAIRSDPALAEILASNEPMGIDQIMVVMNSDAVLNLFDQAEFMERAAKIFGESDLAMELP